MEDIKYTLSSDKSLRSSTIVDEEKWLKKCGKLYYSVGKGKPQRTDIGCWVYFIKNGVLAARSKIIEISQSSDNPKTTYTGAVKYSGPWEIVIASMELAVIKDLKHKGFQGFRYVTADERSDFDKCFV